MSAQTFDPGVYKETTRKQWQDAAEAWDRWGDVIERWLGPATEVMLDMAGIQEGSRVLDVAAGAGGQSLAAARRVGQRGSVLATDIASNLLDFAKKRARERASSMSRPRSSMGSDSTWTRPRSTWSSPASASSTSQTSRRRCRGCGVRSSPAASSPASCTRRLRPTSLFFSIPVSIIRRRAELPPPAPGQPGLGRDLHDRAALMQQ